jgi:hypothetical protein
MAPHLLVSICNVAANPRPTCLLRLDVETQRVQWIDVGAEELLVSGVGICTDDRYVYHASVAQAGFVTLLTVLDRDTLKVLHVQRLPEVRDVHSLALMDDELFVAATETDEIVAYRLHDMEAVERRMVWTPTGARQDTHHVNSLAVVNGELLCSAFGLKEGDSWVTAPNGYIYNVTRDERVLEGLRQPHSVVWHDDQLFVCNSQEGSVNTADGAVAYLVGYSRGLTFGPDGTMYAGTSLSRRPSQPTGDAVFLNPTGQGQLHGQCAVIEIPPSGGHRLEMGMSGHGSEIYDLVLL